MKTTVFILTMVFVASCSTPVSISSDSKAADQVSSLQWPTTVQEAVVVLKTQWFTAENIEWIRNNPKNYVISELHFPFGIEVRRAFGLWGENKELLASCGDDFAEACSDIIFDALWESIQKEGLVKK